MRDRFVLASVFFVSAILSAVPARAVCNQSDDASQSAYSGGWTNGADGGSGFGAWVLTPSPNNGNGGFFIGDSRNNGAAVDSNSDGDINTTGNKAWGVYANSGTTADAVRAIDAPLIVGQIFKLDFDNGFIDGGGNPGAVGFGLQTSGGQNRFEFYFKGGNANYFINDNRGLDQNSGVTFTDEGLHIEFQLTGADTYSITVTRKVNGASTTITNTLAGTAGAAIAKLRFFNYNPGSGGSSKDAFYNSLCLDCNGQPSVTASNDGPRCVGEILHLYATGNTNDVYSWTGPNSFTSSSQNPVISNVTQSASGTYTVTRTAGLCSQQSQTSVTINPNPSTTAANNGPVCVGQTLQLSATGPTNGFYNWTGPNFFTSTQQNPAITNAQLSHTGTYSVSLTISNCASPLSSTFAIVTNAAATTASNNGPVCSGQTLQLSATGDAGDTYAWTGPNGFSSSSQNPSISNVQTNQAGVYHVTRTVAGCGIASNSTTVAVKLTPVTSASNSGPVCVGDVLDLFATGSGKDTYSWTGPNGFTSDEQNPSIKSVTLADAGTYTVTRTVDGCTSAASNTFVVVNAGPACSISGATAVCAGSTNVYTGPASAPMYSWSVTGSASIVGSTIDDTVTVAAGTGTTYTVMLQTTSKEGCSTFCSLPVTVRALPTAIVSGTTNICAGAAATIQAALTGTANWILTWSDGVITTNAASPATRSVSPGATTTYTITQVRDANCIGTSTGSAVVNVGTAPAITTQPLPATQTSRYGTNITYSVSTSGAGLTYQWHKSVWATNGWTLATSGPNAGHFIGSSTGNGSGAGPGIDVGGKAWGLYANTFNLAEAMRPFYGDLIVDQLFSIDVDNGFLDGGASVGFGLRNAQGQNRFEFYFKGGNSNYFIHDSRGLDQDTGIPFTDGGLRVEFRLTGLDTYSVKITRLVNSAVTTITNSLAGDHGTGVTLLRLFNFNAGSGAAADAFFNSISIGDRVDHANRPAYADGWQTGDNGGETMITGATASSLALSNISTNDSGRYYVVVAGSCGPSVTSSSAVLRAVGFHPPSPPVIHEPENEGQIVNAADAHLETDEFADPDAPLDDHRCTDWEIRLQPSNELIWTAPCVSNSAAKVHIHLADGAFVGSHTGMTRLMYSTNYVMRVRFRDTSGNGATEWSDWSQRGFQTTAEPGGNPNQQWQVAPGYVIETVAPGLELPVNIAFVANPGNDPTNILCYVTELYGIIKVVKRDGSLGDYANDLLNFDVFGGFPGSGELGLTGLCVEPASGDVFASMLYSSDPGNPNAPLYPKVVRFHSTDGGLTAASQTTVIDMAGETHGASHQISNLSIGPDGKLYVHMGDGFNTPTAQNLDSFRGKILRMNLDGTPCTDNPFYDAGNGTNARDYVYAYGFRNPFGGAWRAADGKHYEVENGPTVDRFARVNAGQNYLWDGSNASMTNGALYTWSPQTAPVNVTFIETNTFGGSGFPFTKWDHAFVSESGPTYAEGEQSNGKHIREFVINTNGVLVAGPTTLVKYIGTGFGTVVGLAAGPDGLYFTDLYEDTGAQGPTARGANLYRVRFVGLGDKINGGVAHTIAVKTNGTMWTWGQGQFGQLGHGTTAGTNAPTQVAGFTNVVAVTAGIYHSAALDANGRLWTWGYNGMGQLGNGTTTNTSSPQMLTTISNIVAIADMTLSHFSTAAIASDRTVWTWGDGWAGQLGNGSTNNSSVPVQVVGLSNVVAMASGFQHCVALRRDGTVWTWGLGTFGQLGNGGWTNSSTPVQVTGLSNVVAVAATGGGSLALKSDHSVWGWGNNYYGEFANGSTANTNRPVRASITNVVALATGWSHVLALKPDGSVWGIGNNYNGQMGQPYSPPTNSYSAYVQVPGVSNVVGVAAGMSHSFVVRDDGTVWGFGMNYDSQLGAGALTNVYSATQVGGGFTLP